MGIVYDILSRVYVYPLENTKLKEFFNVIITAEDVGHGKLIEML